MIKRTLCLICSVIMLILVGCTGSSNSIKETSTETAETGEVPETPQTDPEVAPTHTATPEKNQNTTETNPYAYFKSFDIVLDESKNHKLLTDTEQTGYKYYVYDNHGEVIDCGYHDYRGCSFSVRDGYLVYYNGGLTATWYERYYDLESGRVSKFFLRPLDTYKNSGQGDGSPVS